MSSVKSLSKESLEQIRNPEHVKYVLGINIQLNESELNQNLLEEIVKKQLIFENFLDSLKKYLGDSFNTIVNVIKSPFDIAILIKNLVSNPRLLDTILNTYKSKIESYKQKFKETLLSLSDSIKEVTQKIKSIPKEIFDTSKISMEKVIEFYQKIVEKISTYFSSTIDFIKDKIGDGWLGLLKIIVSTGVLAYASDKIGSYVKKITTPLKMVTDPKKFIDEMVNGETKKNVDEVSKGLDSSIKDVFNGLGKLAGDTIDKITSFFSDIIKSKNWLWKYIVDYLSKIADMVKKKMNTVPNKIDLTHYGRMERDLSKIKDNYFRKISQGTLLKELNKLKQGDIYYKNKDMLNINKIVKKNIENLLETKGFEDMEVAFGVRHKSDNLSDAEKNQFGPMGQLKTTDGGSFKNPDINGMKVTDASKKEAGSEAQAYYREVAKKVKDFQKPDDGQTIGGPRVPTNTGDDNERLENTGYDIGISGMEVVADLAAEKGGSEETKKIYKDRVAKLQGDKSNYTPMSKNAKETNDLKYKKDARNTRPVKSQTSKQVEEGLENSSDIVTEADFKISSDVEKLMSTIETKVKKMYPKLFQRVDQPVEKAQIIALFAKIFGISPQELSRVKTVMDKAEKSGESTQSTEESDNNTDSMTENTFKVKGKIISEQQVLKLTKKLPAKIKIDETVFSVTDGETTYKLIWEGDSKTGEAVITNKNNKTQVNEDIQKMKHLWNFDSKESLSTKKNIKEDGEDAFRRIFKKIKEDKK